LINEKKTTANIEEVRKASTECLFNAIRRDLVNAVNKQENDLFFVRKRFFGVSVRHRRHEVDDVSDRKEKRFQIGDYRRKFMLLCFFYFC
jgi:hypothetical protein